jgi:osmotically-inducible protein OsmY
LRRSEEASDVHIVIKAQKGRVKLAGIVADEFEAKAAQKVAAAVKGVLSVEADLKLFSRQR